MEAGFDSNKQRATSLYHALPCYAMASQEQKKKNPSYSSCACTLQVAPSRVWTERTSRPAPACPCPCRMRAPGLPVGDVTQRRSRTPVVRHDGATSARLVFLCDNDGERCRFLIFRLVKKSSFRRRQLCVATARERPCCKVEEQGSGYSTL